MRVSQKQVNILASIPASISGLFYLISRPIFVFLLVKIIFLIVKLIIWRQ